MSRGIFPVLLTAVLLAAASAHAAVTISSAPTQNMNCTGGVCSPTSADAVLNAGDLAAMLSGGGVTVAPGALAQDIVVAVPISWTSASRLTLDAYRSIAFDAPVKVAGRGALTITTDDGGTDGDFRFFQAGRVAFAYSDSSLVINGNTYAQVRDLKAFARLLHRQDSRGKFYALTQQDNLKRRIYPHAIVPVTFRGTFEGLGNAITNMSIIDQTLGDSVGLFAEIGGDSDAVVRDIVLRDVSIEGAQRSQLVGGLAAKISAPGARVSGCSVSGNITASFNSTLGGLAGANLGTIDTSVSTAALTADARVDAAGGLAGFNGGTITRSYATGAVMVAAGAYAGGLVGDNLSGSVVNSYATGAVSGKRTAKVGGLVGSNGSGNPSSATSYATGAVAGGTKGGLIGLDNDAFHKSDDYWDMNSSGIDNPSKGAGNVSNDPGITGLTTAQFQSGLPAGFDPAVWGEDAAINGGYPYLLDNPPQ